MTNTYDSKKDIKQNIARCLGSGAYQLKKEFDTDEEFKKMYYKIFPES